MRVFYHKHENGLMGMALIMAILVSLFPLLSHPGIPFGHDASFHLGRVAALADALSQGTLFPGVYADYFNGYGYAIGLFYPDFFLYVPAVLTVAGLSNVLAFKAYLCLLTAAMGISMYISVYKMGHHKGAALISSCLYLWCSYHSTNLYFRSALGELQAFVFFPLVVTGLWLIIFGNRDWKWLALGMTGIVLSHILSAVMTVGLILVMILCFIPRFIEDYRRLLALVKAGLMTLGLTAFFALPMVEQMMVNPIWGDTGLLGSIADWAVTSLSVILAIPTDFGSMYVPPPGIGIVLAALALLGLFLIPRATFEAGQKRFTMVLVIVALLSLFMASTLFPWHWLAAVLQTMQFPWRLYLVASVLISFCGGPILSILSGRIHLATLAVCLLILLGSFGLNTHWAISLRGTVTENPYPSFPAGCEYLPKTVNYGNLITLSSSGSNILVPLGYNQYQFDHKREGDCVLPLIYYPGYQAWTDGKSLRVSETSEGYVVIKNAPVGTISMAYTGTLLRKGAMVISSFVLLGWIIVGLLRYYKRREAPHVRF